MQADARYDNIVSNLLGRIIVVEDINEASRVARDNGFRSRVVTMDGQVINAGGSFTGGSVQRSAGLFTRKQEMEELRIRAAKLQKDCLAAQEKTDQCKEQVDALQAELTATASEQITAANDVFNPLHAIEAVNRRCEHERAKHDSGNPYRNLEARKVGESDRERRAAHGSLHAEPAHERHAHDEANDVASAFLAERRRGKGRRGKSHIGRFHSHEAHVGDDNAKADKRSQETIEQREARAERGTSNKRRDIEGVANPNASD